VPEGDNVWRDAQRLGRALAGNVLVHSDFRVPRYATVDLAGRRVLAVTARGKHLVTRVEGNLTLHTHLEMDGAWHLVPAGGRWPRAAGPAWQVRLVLRTEQWQAVGYRLPVIDLDSTDREDRYVGHLGPDVLGPDWDTDRAVTLLLREPARAVGIALLDQRNLAGPGNVYRTEALFLQGISPWSPLQDVNDPRALVERTRELMVHNRDRPHRTTTGSTRRGEELWVYGRAGRPCRRCGTPIRSAGQGPPGAERATAWCPHCQP
jgi:endonuclease-8